MHRQKSTHCLMVALVSVAMLSGCESMNKTVAGTLLGAGAGALLGQGIGGSGKATAVGAAAGAVLGGLVGYYMDAQDRKKWEQALETAPTGTPINWENANTGKYYTVTPTSPTYAKDGRQCREFEQEVEVDGQPQVIRGTACKRLDGDSWDVS